MLLIEVEWLHRVGKDGELICGLYGKMRGGRINTREFFFVDG